MGVFNGTGGNDSLVGTDGDDTFNESSLGQDVLVGGGGYDTALIDYSAIPSGQVLGVSIGYMLDGVHARIQSVDGTISVDTYSIEKLDIKTSSSNNGFQIDLSQVFGWNISIDAGAGQDYLNLTMYYDSPALVGNVTTGFTSGNLTIKNIEQFYLNLGLGNDHLTLGSGHDTVKANAGDDYVDGGDGNDLLEGNLGGDTLIGGAGDDGVYASDSYSFTDNGSERDILSGGSGNDTVSAGYGDDADGGTGTDVLSLSMQGGSSGAVLDLSAVFAGGSIVVGGGTIKGFESYGNIYGTDFDDTITTGNAAAVGSLLARGVFGYGGNDTITTGIYEDSIDGMDGNDVIRSGGGNDRASGGNGNDQVYGEAGNDTLWGGDGDDLVQGGDGNDNILGGFGADQIWGDAGDDSIDGEGGDDLLYGGAGKDTLIGGGGVDRLEGGANDDVYVVDGFDTVVELAGGGIDEVRTDAEFFSVAAMGEIENLNGISWPFVSQTLIGNDLANRIDGGAGADRMEGGLGNDTYIVDDAGDLVVENANAGIDEVQAGFTFTLGANVENLTLKGYEVDGYGNELANVITGTEFDNILFGYGGNDQLVGGNGADILAGGDGNDTINGGANEFWAFDIASYTGATSGVTVNLALTAAQNTIGAGTDTLIGIEGVSGSSFNDTLLGNTAANAILGEAGNDILTGGAGADRLTGGGGDDTFRDTIAGLSGDTITDFAIGDKIVFSNATLATFTYKLTDTTLTFSGGSLTLEAPINGTIVASAAAGGGVQLTVQASTIRDVDNDFNGDGRSDILFHHDNGAITNFLGKANGGILNNGDNIYTVMGAEWHVAGTGDFNGDGRDDILWRDDIFNAMFTFLGRANGGVLNNGETSYASYDASWTVSGIGDFNGDGRDDILFRDANGVIFDYLGTASGGFTGNTDNLYTDIADAWHVSGVGDFNGDGRDDILFRNDNGAITNFLGTANGGILNNGDNIYTVVGNAWHVAGVGDFNGDGRDDILWRNDNGAVFNFLGTANGGVANNGDNSYAAMSNVWHVEAIGDYNGDGRDDILWRHDNGTIIDWLGTASGGFTDNSGNLFTSIVLQWQVAPADALI